MSTRAYKVLIPAVIADDATWNVTWGQKINDALNLDDYEGEQPVDIKWIKRLMKESWLDDETRKQFAADIKDEPKDGVIYYELF